MQCTLQSIVQVVVVTRCVLYLRKDRVTVHILNAACSLQLQQHHYTHSVRVYE